jgi:hypothetical protein
LPLWPMMCVLVLDDSLLYNSQHSRGSLEEGRTTPAMKATDLSQSFLPL